MLLALPFDILGTDHASCIVGGIATPTDWNILPHTPWLWLRMERRRPSSSIVTRCRAFKSCLISAHSKRWPCFQEALVKLFSKHQRQKAAKHMAPDGAVSLVEDRTRLQ